MFSHTLPSRYQGLNPLIALILVLTSDLFPNASDTLAEASSDILAKASPSSTEDENDHSTHSSYAPL